MRVTIVAEVLPKGWEWSVENPVTGGNRFVVNTAEWLAKFGHAVTVIMDRVTGLNRNGVDYRPRSPVPVDTDVVLECNARSITRYGTDTRVVWWTSFADFKLDLVPGHYIDAVCVISQYAAGVAGDGDLDSPQMFVTPLGIDKKLFSAGPPLAEREALCVYSSSPDRGGTALKAAWDNVYNLTGYRLECTGYSADPKSDADLADLYRRARYWLHPGMGTELFCLSACEAQACGAVPIVNPVGGLHETVKWGHRFGSGEYLQGLISVLQSATVGSANADHVLSWEDATRNLEAVLSE